MLLALAAGLAWAFPAVAEAAPGWTAPAPGEPAEDDDPRALQAAIRALRAQLAAEPGNLGAQLDLGIALCLSGQTDEALQRFVLLESLPALPPAIAEVIAWYRSGGCRPRPVAWTAFAASGLGWARNFNLAPLSDVIDLPALDTQLALDESSRRRDAAMATAEAGGLWPLSADRRWVASGFLQALRYRGSPDHAFTAAQGSLGWRAQTPQQVSEAQAALGAVTVGPQTRIHTATLAAVRLWPAGPGLWAGGSFSHSWIDYDEQPALNARQAEVRARVRWQGAVARVTADLGWMEDRQRAERPGGNRRGPVLQVHGVWALPGERSLDATLRQGWMQDSAPYSPALFGEQQRAPRVTTWSATLRQPLAPQLNLRLEWRMTNSRDVLELFKYSSQSAGVSLEWMLGGGRP